MIQIFYTFTSKCHAVSYKKYLNTFIILNSTVANMTT